MCKPLTHLLKNDIYIWNEGAIIAFQQLKNIMTNPPMLTLPNLDKEFIMETDLSNRGMKTVLM